MLETWLIILGIGFLAWLGRRPEKRARDPVPFAMIPPEPDFAPKPSLSLAERRATSSRSSRSTARWFGPGESTTVQNKNLPGGMVYVGPSPSNPYDNRATAHVIDPSLSARANRPDVEGKTMPYWPHYAEMTPAARRAYLTWHETGRRDQNFGIGHVFLFFYGLEHRLFIDRSVSDYEAITSEVRALLEAYPADYSFQSRGREFLAAARILFGKTGGPPKLTADLLRTYTMPLDLRLAVSRRLNEGPLTGDWLLLWYLMQPDKYLRTPAARCFEEYKELFLLKFAARFSEGLAVQKSRKSLRLEYALASGARTIQLTKGLSGLTDLDDVREPLEIAKTITSECMDALDAYSRFIGKRPSAAATPSALALLPKELSSSPSAGESLELFRKNLTDRLNDGFAVMSFGDLVSTAGLAAESSGRVSKATAMQLSSILDKLDIGIEPDPRYNGITPTMLGDSIVFPASAGAPVDPLSPHLAAARILVDVASAACKADGQNRDAGFRLIRQEIARLPHLMPSERLRLTAQCHLAAAATDRRSLNPARVKALPVLQRELIARVALGALTVDGRLALPEIQFAERLYTALGIASDRVYQDLHGVGDAGPATIQQAQTGAPEIAIPPRPNPAPSPKPSSSRKGEGQPVDDGPPAPSKRPIVDERLLQKKRDETSEVQIILRAEWDKEDDDIANAVPAAQPPMSESFPGLRRAYENLIMLLIDKKGRLERTVFEARAGELGLPADGTLEVLNDWSFDTFDEPLIEEGDLLLAETHMIEKLKAMAARA